MRWQWLEGELVAYQVWFQSIVFSRGSVFGGYVRSNCLWCMYGTWTEQYPGSVESSETVNVSKLHCYQVAVYLYLQHVSCLQAGSAVQLEAWLAYR